MALKQIHHETHLTHMPIFWDALIVLLLIVGATSAFGSWTWITTHPDSSNALRMIVGVIGVLGFLGFLLTFWGSFMEPRLIILNKKSIHVKGLPELTIAVIADLHVGPYKGRKYAERIVQKANALKADVIVLPGDFIYDSNADLSDLQPLENLRARLGVFAVLGNHDTGHMLLQTKREFISYRTPDRSADVIATLKRLGITLLQNEHRLLNIGDERFAIAGTNHCWMDDCSPDHAFAGIPVDVPIVLVTHIPDAITDKHSTRASLIICGHTHGGQIRLPFIGPVCAIPDQLGRAFDQGLFTLKNGTILAITHGIGETMARARLFCPPEIMMISINHDHTNVAAA
jgi:uncharacterized protein